MAKTNPNPKSNKEDIVKLNKTIEGLNSKVAKLEAEIENEKPKKEKHFPVRKLIISTSVVLATLLLMVGNIFFWTARTVVDTNRYVATVGPLIKQPPIQNAIAQYTTDQIFNNYDVTGYVQQVLPPKADFLAPSIVGQVKNYTQSTINGLLKNQKVQDFWYQSLQKNHEALINFSKTYQGNGALNVSDIYSILSQRLSTTKLSFLANKKLPAKVANIKVTNVGWLPAFHKLVVNINLYQGLAYLFFAITTFTAIVLSKKKTRMIIKLGIIFAASMLLTLIILRISRGIVVNQISQAYQPAIKSAYDTIISSLISHTLDIFTISLIIAVIAWIVERFKLVDKAKPKYREYKNKLLASK